MDHKLMEQTKINNLTQYLVPLSIVIAGAIIGSSLYFGGADRQAVAEKDVQPTPKAEQPVVDTTEKIRPRIRNKYWSIEFQTPRISYLELLTEDGLILTQEEGGAITTETEPRDRTEDLATYWRQGKVAADRQKCGIR